ncbi:winged helix-turn-helix transcriptional regulator [Streptomyces sp. NPDC015125]|uniref:winged helix-turn-helix transcriptional regulator n=1 Tax=Streptomyces sp. NPDC015125 TaxID=3364938 RepID=UPI0036FDA920
MIPAARHQQVQELFRTELGDEPLPQDGALGFRPLQQRRDGMSSSVLQQRLTELQEARLVERDAEEGYRLTALGKGASDESRGLHRWSELWAAELDDVPAEAAGAQ